ncbi:MAG: hypothetical protein ABJG33_12575 [Balneola sp.]
MDEIKEQIRILYPNKMEKFIKENAGFSGWEQYKEDIQTLTTIALSSDFNTENERNLIANYVHELFRKADISKLRNESFLSLVKN